VPTTIRRRRIPCGRHPDIHARQIHCGSKSRTRPPHAVLCERPAKFEINGNRVTMEFRDGWKVG
jgi:hypothetical protein